MSDADLAAMRTAGDALLTALASRDPHAIEAATCGYRCAVAAVRSCGAWRATPALHSAALELLAHVDLLTVRVGNLTRLSSERLAALDAAGAVAQPTGYRPARASALPHFR